MCHKNVCILPLRDATSPVPFSTTQDATRPNRLSGSSASQHMQRSSHLGTSPANPLSKLQLINFAFSYSLHTHCISALQVPVSMPNSCTWPIFLMCTVKRAFKKKNYHLKYPQTEGVLWCLHFLFNEHTVTHSNTVWSYNQTSCLISDFTMSRSEIFKVHPLNQLSHSSSALRNFISSPWKSLRLTEVCPPQSCKLYCVWIYNLRNEQVWQWSGDNQEPIPRHWPLWVSKPEGTQWLRPFWAKTRPRDTKFPCGASAMGMTGTKASDIIFGRSSNGESCNTLRLEIYVQQSQPNHPTRFKFTSQHRQ